MSIFPGRFVANVNTLSGPLAGRNGVLFQPGVSTPTPPPTPTYLINQNFETPTTGYDNGETWTETGGGIYINPAYTVNPILGTQSLKLGQDGSNASHATETTFTAKSDVWAFCKFKPISFNSTGDAFELAQFALKTAGGSLAADMTINSSGNVAFWTNSTSSSASATTLSLNLIYNVWIHFVSGGTCALYMSTSTTRPTVDGGGNVVLTKTGASVNVNTVSLSSGYFNSSQFLFDHILVSASEIGNNP